MSAFTNHLDLSELDDAKGDPILTSDGRAQWQVSGRLTFEVGFLGSGETITLEDGDVTDLGSTPQITWSLGFPPDAYPKAYAVHDKLYRHKGEYCGVLPYPPPLRGFRLISYTRSEADKILRDALLALRCPKWRAWVIWAAVRVGGAGAWGT